MKPHRDKTLNKLDEALKRRGLFFKKGATCLKTSATKNSMAKRMAISCSQLRRDEENE